MKKKLLWKLKINVRSAEEWNEGVASSDSESLAPLKISCENNSLSPIKIDADSLTLPSTWNYPTQYEFRSIERTPGIVWIEDNLFISNSASANNEEILK